MPRLDYDSDSDSGSESEFNLDMDMDMDNDIVVDSENVYNDNNNEFYTNDNCYEGVRGEERKEIEKVGYENIFTCFFHKYTFYDTLRI